MSTAVDLLPQGTVVNAALPQVFVQVAGTGQGLNENDTAQFYLREMPASTSGLFVALWRYKRTGRKSGAGVTGRNQRRRWVHPSHDNGSGVIESVTGANVDAGAHNDNGGTLLPARNSEWVLPSGPFVRTNVGDMTEWLNAGTSIVIPAGGGVFRARGNQKSVFGANKFHRALFRFSLMRRETPTGPREIGPWSEVLILSPTRTPDYVAADDETIRFRMFLGSGRVF